MGSGGGIGKLLGVATLGLSNAIAGDHAQKKAIEAQTLAMQQATQAQQQAQEKALEQQRLAQEQANQANEKAQRATANLNTDVRDNKNKNDLTSGIAKKAKTSQASLGSEDTLGLDDDDQEDWF